MRDWGFPRSEGGGEEGEGRRGRGEEKGGQREEEEAASSKEAPFPMEMRCDWCPLASPCIISLRPLSCKLIQMTTLSPRQLAQHQEVSHTTPANADRPGHHLSLIIFPPALPRGLLSATTPSFPSQLLLATFNSTAVDDILVSKVKYKNKQIKTRGNPTFRSLTEEAGLIEQESGAACKPPQNRGPFPSLPSPGEPI